MIQFRKRSSAPYREPEDEETEYSAWNPDREPEETLEDHAGIREYGSTDPEDWQRAAEEGGHRFMMDPDDLDAAADRRRRAEELRQHEEEEAKEQKREAREKKRAQRVRARHRFISRHRKALRRTAVITGVLCGLLLAGVILCYSHMVTDVEVKGNTLHTDEEITDIVCQGPLFLGHNSLYLAWRYRNSAVEGVPFVEKMTVSILSPHSIRITVVEKVLAGYVSYLGDYMYFTRDGTVVEASDQKVDGVPEVTGLGFSHIIIGQKLPVEDSSVFDRILDITQLLDKYSLSIDRIYFDSSSNMSLFYGKVRVDLGRDEYTQEKVASLSYILPQLTGRDGTVDMTDFTPDTASVSFRETGSGSYGNEDANIVDGSGETAGTGGSDGGGTDTVTVTGTETGPGTEAGTETETDSDQTAGEAAGTENGGSVNADGLQNNTDAQ